MREKLIELIRRYDFDSTQCNLCNKTDEECSRCGSECLADYLLENNVVVLPYVPISEIIGNRLKDGQWVNSTNKDGKCVCIICGKQSDKRTDFCPNCGARNY